MFRSDILEILQENNMLEGPDGKKRRQVIEDLKDEGDIYLALSQIINTLMFHQLLTTKRLDALLPQTKFLNNIFNGIALLEQKNLIEEAKQGSSFGTISNPLYNKRYGSYAIRLRGDAEALKKHLDSLDPETCQTNMIKILRDEFNKRIDLVTNTIEEGVTRRQLHQGEMAEQLQTLIKDIRNSKLNTSEDIKPNTLDVILELDKKLDALPKLYEKCKEFAANKSSVTGSQFFSSSDRGDEKQSDTTNKINKGHS